MGRKTLGDDRYGVWLGEVISDVLQEDGDHRMIVDMNLLLAKLRSDSELKAAQFAMQVLAQDLKKLLDGKDVRDATGDAMSVRLLLGSIGIAYCIARGSTESLPAELSQIVQWHPIIVECIDFVAGDQDRFT